MAKLLVNQPGGSLSMFSFMRKRRSAGGSLSMKFHAIGDSSHITLSISLDLRV